MGGLRAASGAGSSGVAMACVVASEVATVLAVMRRNVRWAGVRYGGDDGGGAEEEHLDHPLIAGLKSLRRRAAAWGTRWPEDPLLCLRPFLDVVRSDETGAPITGFALSSLHKLLSLDLVAPGGGAAEAMGAVVEAVTGCRFEVTDPASEEAVLARVLQVLLACVRGRAAPALSNRHACAIVTTCFRVVQQAGTKGELLQRVSRQTMQEVIRCVFGRLADIEPTTIVNEQTPSRLSTSANDLLKITWQPPTCGRGACAPSSGYTVTTTRWRWWSRLLGWRPSAAFSHGRTDQPTQHS